MRVAIFDTHRFERTSLERMNRGVNELLFLEVRVNEFTAPLALGYGCVCCFVNDHLDAQTLATLSQGGTKLVALRSAGVNNVDLRAAQERGISVVRVPEYSPHAVAEHAIALILTLNRKTHRAYSRVREGNFSLDGLVGFDLYGKTVGIIGTGRIGAVMAQAMAGFGCRVLAHDIKPNPHLRGLAEYVDMEEILRKSDIISLHVPLTPKTHHLLDRE